MDGAPDTELLSRATAGDAAALGLLTDRYAGPLYDFAARLTRDRDEAFEVVRETLLVAARGIHAGPAPSEVKSWLFSIARANVLAIVEGERRTSLALSGRGLAPEPLDAIDPARFATPEEAEAARALAPIAWEAAATLETRRLGLLLLHQRERLGPRETAIASGMQPQNGTVVVSRLTRAMEDAAWALLFLREPERRCPTLSTLLAGTPPETLTPATRRVVTRHMSECARCTAQRSSGPTMAAVFGALIPAALPSGDFEAIRAAAMAGFAQARSPAPPPPVIAAPASVPGPRGARVLAAFFALACVAGVLGALLLVPSSPIALTRDRSTSSLPVAATPSSDPSGVAVIVPTGTATPPKTPSAPPGSPNASRTPARPRSTPTPGGAAILETATAEPTAKGDDTPSASRTPSPAASASVTPVKTPTRPPSSPTPGGTETCTPLLSTNVRQVNVAGGSSSFTVFNSYCRAVQFSLDVAATDTWLHVQQQFGTLEPGGFVTIGLTADRASLPEGTTMGSMTLTWVDGTLEIPVSVVVSGGAPIVGPVQAACGPANQVNFFNARVIDDYGVKAVTLTTVAADGATTDIPMTMASGDPRAGGWTAEPSGGIASFTVTASDFAGHATTFPGTCSNA